MSTEQKLKPSVEKYILESRKLLAEQEQIKSRMKNMKFDTIAVHGLYSVEEAISRNQGAVIEPLFLASSQGYRDADELEAAQAYLIPSWAYTRIANPTTFYLEQVLALLEGYKTGRETSCAVTSSGLAAIMLATSPLLAKQKTGPEPINFVSSIQIYGGTYQLFSVRIAQERGLEVRWIQHPEDLEEWKAKIDENTRFLYVEAPSNPQQSFCDLKALSDLAQAWEIPLIVDATCATPALLRPISYGADIVVHSVTKSMTASGLAPSSADGLSPLN